MNRILGQEHAVGQIQGAIASGRMHHAWIFHGPSGVGKFTAAIETAKLLLCHQRGTDLTGQMEACGMCASCRLIDEEGGTHPDLHVITKEMARDSEQAHVRRRKQSNIPIDLLRERMVGGYVGSGDSRKFYESTVGKSGILKHGKVFVVDEAELIDIAGQNAMLKTLEEPPSETTIILVSSHDERLIATIRSRCQRVRFALLEDDVVRGILAAEAKEAGLGQGELDAVVRFAEGSAGLGYLAIAYRLDEWERKLGPMIERMGRGEYPGMLGAAMAEVVEDFAVRWVKDHDNASKDAANKMGVGLMLGLLGRIARNRVRDEAARLEAGDRDSAERAMGSWLEGIDLMQEAERQMGSNVSVGLLLDNLAIQWSQRI